MYLDLGYSAQVACSTFVVFFFVTLRAITHQFTYLIEDSPHSVKQHFEEVSFEKRTVQITLLKGFWTAAPVPLLTNSTIVPKLSTCKQI